MKKIIEFLKEAAFKLFKGILNDRGFSVEARPAALINHPGAQYRPNFFDIIANHTVTNGHKPFFFVQIGAHDGISNDPIFQYVHQYGWHGILVEPRQDSLEILQRNYADIPDLRFIKAAVARQTGMRILYRFDRVPEDWPEWASGLASLDLPTVLKHSSTIPGIEEHIATEEVRCMTINELLAEVDHDGVDLLQVDAEGLDAEIITSIDFTSDKTPSIIRFEHKHLNIKEYNDCLELLINMGYEIVIEQVDTIGYRRGAGGNAAPLL